jgi:hypothetical protein
MVGFTGAFSEEVDTGGGVGEVGGGCMGSGLTLTVGGVGEVGGGCMGSGLTSTVGGVGGATALEGSAGAFPEVDTGGGVGDMGGGCIAKN